MHRAGIQGGVAAVVDACRRAGAPVFFAAMAVLPVLGFSLFAFVVAAGPVFAPVLGTGAVIGLGLAALAVNVTISYVVTTSALRPWVLGLVQRFGCRLPPEAQSAGWEVGLLVRLLPGPPFGLQSCVLALAGMRFGPYFATSIVIPGLYYSTLVALGRGALSHNPWVIAAALIFLGVVCVACHRLKLRLSARAASSGQGKESHTRSRARTGRPADLRSAGL